MGCFGHFEKRFQMRFFIISVWVSKKLGPGSKDNIVYKEEISNIIGKQLNNFDNQFWIVKELTSSSLIQPERRGEEGNPP